MSTENRAGVQAQSFINDSVTAHGSCSNPPPEVEHEQEERKVGIPDAPTWSLADRVSMSPAHDSLHGLWPLATCYQFVDRNDEASFVAKDFATMRPTHLLLMLLEMTVPPYSLTPLGVQSRPLTWPVTVIVVIQLVACYLDADSTRGVDWYSKFYFATTFAMWCAVVFAQQRSGFAPIASDSIFLVLFFIFVFLQGLLVCSTIGYDAKSFPIFMLFFNAVCTIHLYLFDHSSGSASELPSEGGGHASPEPLLAPLAFGLLYFFVTLITVGFVGSQLRARRFHHAELEYMHERLRREKERMGYELAIARKAQSAAAGLVEGNDEGNRRAARSGGSGGLSTSGARSAKSFMSSGMSSDMSELARNMATLRAEDEVKEYEAQQGRHMRFEVAMGDRESKAEERQQRLWTTLAELGIRPKSVSSDVSDQALL